MRKYLFIFIGIFMLGILISTGVQAQVSDLLGLTSSVLIPDWELDYLRPLEPGTLDPGEYRLSLNGGRLDIFGYDTTNFFIGFDSAFENNNYLHLSFDYLPEIGDSEDNANIINLKFTHQYQEDSNIYFGYLRYKGEEDDFDSLDDSVDFYYIGTEYYGSFLK